MYCFTVMLMLEDGNCNYKEKALDALVSRAFFEYPHPSLTSLHIKKSCTCSSTIRFSGKSKKISFRIIIFFIAIDRYCL